MKHLLLAVLILTNAFGSLPVRAITDAGAAKNRSRANRETPPPRIIYWKWDDSILDPGNLERKTNELIDGSNFDLVYVSLHWVAKPFTDPALIAKVERCAAILRRAGRGLMLDIDVRNEGADFYKRHPEERSYQCQVIELDLDATGTASVEEPNLQANRWINRTNSPVETVVNAWAFRATDASHFAPGTLAKIKDRISIEAVDDTKTRLVVRAGAEHANKRALLITAKRHVIPDLFSPNLYTHWSTLFDAVRHIPLAGIGVDEYGPDLTMTRLVRNVTPENFPVSLANRNFTYSHGMAVLYKQRKGADLAEDLIYFRYAPQGGDDRRIKAINDYVENLRFKIVENERWFYDKGKSTFGAETFVGAHPTWWCDRADHYFETFKNGWNWWEVKRDFAQTDEAVQTPIKLALAHKWGGRVWYNMFYSSSPSVWRDKPAAGQTGGVREDEAFFKETWLNARYGGRTHYLGYENGATREGWMEFREQPETLRQVTLMEERLKRLNDFGSSQPDSRVLVLFGMEAATNWAISDPDRKEWFRRGTLMHEALKFSQSLFDAGYLCDMVPTTEVTNGSVKIENGKLTYGTQQYDAAILLLPEGIQREALRTLDRFAARNKNLILVGDSRRYADGTSASRDFTDLAGKLKHRFDASTPATRIAAILGEQKIAGNLYPQGCAFQDGSVLFTADGKLPVGNRLVVNTTIRGARVEFAGEDFLAIEIDKSGKLRRHAAGKIERLTINGEHVALSTASTVPTRGANLSAR